MDDISKRVAETVARYAPETAEDWRGMAGGIYARMRRETNGGYVSFTDYEALAARLAEVEAGIAYTQHTDTMNDLVLLGLARDEATARAEAAEAERDRLAAELAEARAALTEISVKGRTTGFSRVAMAYIAEGYLTKGTTP
jgi:hypothetical protein